MSLFARSVSSLAITLFLLSTISYAQRSGSVPSQKRTSVSSNKVHQRSRSPRIANELQRQQEFLRKVTARFHAVATHDLTPLMQYSYVWTALRENRTRISGDGRLMTGEQNKLFLKGYDSLEKEVVATFGDFQLSILNEVLELNESQLDKVQKAVEDDLNVRRVLLKSNVLSDRQFAMRIDAISAKTETRILAVLFPEQRLKFDRELNSTRNRLVG